MADDNQAKNPENGDEEAEIHEKGTVREYWETICVVLIFVLFARTWVFQNSNIPSGSMKDTLQVGDRLIVNSFVYGPVLGDWERQFLPMREIRRGDIVVFKYPGNPQVPFIKRVIALEGDVVQVVNHHLFVNGKLMIEGYTKLSDSLKTSYLRPPSLPSADRIPELPDFLEQPSQFHVIHEQGRKSVRLKDPRNAGRSPAAFFGPYRIPEGHVFVLGDNRRRSEDSRFWGALNQNLILGRAWIIWWSFEEGDYDYLKNSPRDIARKVWTKIRYFFPMTRWERFLHRPE